MSIEQVNHERLKKPLVKAHDIAVVVGLGSVAAGNILRDIRDWATGRGLPVPSCDRLVQSRYVKEFIFGVAQ